MHEYKLYEKVEIIAHKLLRPNIYLETLNQYLAQHLNSYCRESSSPIAVRNDNSEAD